MSEVSRVTSGIPPLSTIKDPDTRRALEAIVQGWRIRNGDLKPQGDERFITKGELKSLVITVNNGYFSPGGEGHALLNSGAVPQPVADYVSRVVESTTADILNSKIWVKLGEKVPILQLPDLFTRVGAAEVAIQDEVTSRQTADEAIVRSVNALGVRVDSNEAGLVNEANLRTNSDNALATAVNTLWAVVGDSSALVQSGASGVTNRVGAVAEQWSQTQAAIKDPVTGQYVGTAAVRDEAKAEANRIKNRLTAERTIKVDVNGYVAGIGVIAEQDMTTGATSSAVIVRADKFAVGSASTGSAVPFKVYTTQVVAPDGVTVIQPGVYIDEAFVGSGTIGSAKIGYAAIDTLKLAGGSVTTMSYQEGGSGSIVAGWGDYLVAIMHQMPAGSSGVVLNGFVLLSGNGASATVNIMIGKTPSGLSLGTGGSVLLKSTGVSVVNGFYSSYAVTAFDPYPDGSWTYWLATVNPTTGPGANQPFLYSSPSLSLIGGKR